MFMLIMVLEMVVMKSRMHGPRCRLLTEIGNEGGEFSLHMRMGYIVKMETESKTLSILLFKMIMNCQMARWPNMLFRVYARWPKKISHSSWGSGFLSLIYPLLLLKRIGRL